MPQETCSQSCHDDLFVEGSEECAESRSFCGISNSSEHEDFNSAFMPLPVVLLKYNINLKNEQAAKVLDKSAQRRPST